MWWTDMCGAVDRETAEVRGLPAVRKMREVPGPMRTDSASVVSWGLFSGKTIASLYMAIRLSLAQGLSVTFPFRIP